MLHKRYKSTKIAPQVQVRQVLIDILCNRFICYPQIIISLRLTIQDLPQGQGVQLGFHRFHKNSVSLRLLLQLSRPLGLLRASNLLFRNLVWFHLSLWQGLFNTCSNRQYKTCLSVSAIPSTNTCCINRSYKDVHLQL